MKKIMLVGLAVCFLALTFVGWTGGVASVSATIKEKRMITIIDETGRCVKVPLSPERIACLVPTVAEVIYILGDSDKIVARADDCNFPSILQEELSVGSSRALNLELLFEQRPDVIIARTPLKQEIKEKIEIAGVPLIQFRSIELDTVLPMMRSIGLLLDKQERAEELISFIEEYANLVKKRIDNIAPQERPSVFFQSMGHMYWTYNAKTAGHRRIVAAGGINIAANEPVKVPKISAEWVLERNPDIIVHNFLKARKRAHSPSLKEMQEMRREIIDEPGLKEVKAVHNRKVYIIDTRLTIGPRSIIGFLYCAKWFHSELFEDIDPEAIHKEMLQEFYGIELEGTWVYPE